MNTPTHLLVGVAAFAKPDDKAVSLAALAGALMPDASLYVMFFWHQFVIGTPPDVIFGQLYYSDYWQLIFAIDNSFLLWGGTLLAGIALRWQVLIAFAGAGFLHLLCDFPLHHDDARPHFWPVTMWKFESPISYWDPAHYGRVAAALEALFVVFLSVIIWRRFPSRWTRTAVVLGALLTIAPFIVFGLILQLDPA